MFGYFHFQSTERFFFQYNMKHTHDYLRQKSNLASKKLQLYYLNRKNPKGNVFKTYHIYEMESTA